MRLKTIRYFGILMLITFLIACANKESIKGIWEIEKYIWAVEDSAMNSVVTQMNEHLNNNERERMFFEENMYGSMMPDGTKYKEEAYIMTDEYININGVQVEYKLIDNKTLQLSDSQEGLIIQLRKIK
jgi:hypothetical protein